MRVITDFPVVSRGRRAAESHRYMGAWRPGTFTFFKEEAGKINVSPCNKVRDDTINNLFPDAELYAQGEVTKEEAQQFKRCGKCISVHMVENERKKQPIAANRFPFFKQGKGVVYGLRKSGKYFFLCFIHHCFLYFSYTRLFM